MSPILLYRTPIRFAISTEKRIQKYTQKHTKIHKNTYKSLRFHRSYAAFS